jgi:hypothetical protein
MGARLATAASIAAAREFRLMVRIPCLDQKRPDKGTHGPKNGNKEEPAKWVVSRGKTECRQASRLRTESVRSSASGQEVLLACSTGEHTRPSLLLKKRPRAGEESDHGARNAPRTGLGAENRDARG